MAHDNCDGCGQDYDFDKERDVLCLYLNYPECNHVEATCPHCGRSTRIFLVPEGVINLLTEIHLNLRMVAEPPEELLESAQKIWAEELRQGETPFRRPTRRRRNRRSQPKQPSPEPPREWITQLYDDLRHFGGECGKGCGHSN